MLCVIAFFKSAHLPKRSTLSVFWRRRNLKWPQIAVILTASPGEEPRPHKRWEKLWGRAECFYFWSLRSWRHSQKIHSYQRWEELYEKVSTWFWHQTRQIYCLIVSMMERRRSNIDASLNGDFSALSGCALKNSSNPQASSEPPDTIDAADVDKGFFWDVRELQGEADSSAQQWRTDSQSRTSRFCVREEKSV